LQEQQVKVSVEHLPDCQAVLTVEVEPERLAAATEKTLRTLGSQISVPGFRKGKAPLRLVQNYLSPERIAAETNEGLIPQIYKEAIAEAKLDPLELQNMEIQSNDPLTIKFTLVLQPKVSLCDYTQIHLEREPVVVTEEDLYKVLSRLQEKHAEWVPVSDRPARVGDRLTLNVSGTIGDRSFKPANDMTAIVSANDTTLFVGFSQQLEGVSEGETRTLQHTYPARDDEPEKPAEFVVTVKAIHEQRLPSIDDDLARTVGHEDLLKLKETIRENLLQERREQSEQQLRAEIVDELIRRSQVEYPQVMVQREQEHLVAQMEKDLKQRGFTLEAYLRATRQTKEQYLASLEPDARHNVQSGLVLWEVIGKEKIEVSDQEVDDHIQSLIAAAGPNAKAVRDRFKRSEERREVYHRLMEEKLFARLTGLIAPAPEKPVLPQGFVLVDQPVSQLEDRGMLVRPT